MKNKNPIKILAIETSCDETAIAILECSGDIKNPKFNILSNIVASQIKIHAKWGGVVPNLAKREHSKNLVSVLKKSLKDAELLELGIMNYEIGIKNKLNKIFERETELLEQFLKIIPKIKIPKIDAIAVTVGPGLEPALWTGINFARTLSLIWKKPIIPVNHMEGHIVSSLLETKSKVKSQKSKVIRYPALALLVSGGHTELVVIKKPLDYKVIGQTRDDAAGEAFDKVAKLLVLSYPGGPVISKLASMGDASAILFPRPMINSKDFDFSFSGLKTAVLYSHKKEKKMTKKKINDYAASFQQAVIDVLISKTMRAAKKYNPQTIILGGGVAANKELRKQLERAVKNNFPESRFLIPELRFTGDNAAMIALAGYLHYLQGGSYKKTPALKAEGSLKL